MKPSNELIRLRNSSWTAIKGGHHITYWRLMGILKKGREWRNYFEGGKGDSAWRKHLRDWFVLYALIKRIDNRSIVNPFISKADIHQLKSSYLAPALIIKPSKFMGKIWNRPNK